LVAWLWNRARSFVFSTGLSPTVASAAAAGIRASKERPELRERVLKAAAMFRTRLGELGIEPRGFGHVIPWVIGDARIALRVADLVRAQGIDVLAVRPPSVPEGTARIRLTVTAAHEEDNIERAIAAIKSALKELKGRSGEVEWPGAS
jgi:8-amino-7-oxononanoate synthase